MRARVEAEVTKDYNEFYTERYRAEFEKQGLSGKKLDKAVKDKLASAEHKALIDSEVVANLVGRALDNEKFLSRYARIGNNDGFIKRAYSFLRGMVKELRSRGEESEEARELADIIMPTIKSMDRLLQQGNAKEGVSGEKKYADTENKAKAFSEIAASTALYDALDHGDAGDDNLILMSKMPRFVEEKLGITGDFYVYRDHLYENTVSKERAIEEGRPTTRGKKDIHFHNLGEERMIEAIMSINDPIMMIEDKTPDGNPAVFMVLNVLDDDGTPLYASLSFYADRTINGRFEKRPHIVLTISPRPFWSQGGSRDGYAELIAKAVEEKRILSYDKEKGSVLSVIAQHARLGNITEASLNDSISRFKRFVNDFKQKNKINYSLARKESQTNAKDAVYGKSGEAEKIPSSKVLQSTVKYSIAKNTPQKMREKMARERAENAKNEQAQVFAKKDVKIAVDSIEGCILKINNFFRFTIEINPKCDKIILTTKNTEIQMKRNDFLLTSPNAAKLYHEHVKKLPLVDISCRFSAKDIAENKKISNITELWLYGNRWLQRTMRACGIDEKYITGCASDFEKFKEICHAMPMLLGNPQNVACHCDLETYFDCDLAINPDNCENIWLLTSNKLMPGSLGITDMIKNAGVSAIFTREPPQSDLKQLKRLTVANPEIKIIPTLDIDPLTSISAKGIEPNIRSLGNLTSIDVSDIDSFTGALSYALDNFMSLGCVAVIHTLSDYTDFVKPDKYHANEILRRIIRGEKPSLSAYDKSLWHTQLLRTVGLECIKRDLTLQLDMGNNVSAEAAVSLFDYLQGEGALPKSVIMPHAPMDTLLAAELCGSFSRPNAAGTPSIICGICDELAGEQIRILSSLIPLGSTVICASFDRIDMLKRYLCQSVGEWLDNCVCNDFQSATATVEKTVYFNITNQFVIDNKQK